jgi:hypothetical protein
MEDDEGVVSAGNFVYRPRAADIRCARRTALSILVSSTDQHAPSLVGGSSPTTMSEVP